MADDKRVQHKIGQVVLADQVDVDSRVARIAGKRFKVTPGNSCTCCALTGLGHVLCPEIRCSSHDRDDGHGVVYVDQEEQ